MTPLLIGPLAALLSGLVWWLVDPKLLLPTFAILVSSQIQEVMRRGLLTQFRYVSAIPGDALSYVGQAAVLGLLSRHFAMTLPVALWIMAATSLLGAATQRAQLSLKGSARLPMRPMIADFWSIGHWSLTTNGLNIARTMCLPWLLTAMAGPAAAGAFQIGMNLVNVVNPIVSGVCNVVPQIASRAMRYGYRAAWSASWPSIGVGLPLVAGFMAILLIAPSQILGLVYGTRVDVALLLIPVRILAVGSLFYYIASTVCAYLLGVLRGRDALMADGVTTLAMTLMGPVFVAVFGIDGACAALVLTFALRAGVLLVYAFIRVRSDRVQSPIATREHQERPA
ncbi:hypothetical protein [Lichenihabitans psoromatis]|uniref:hypothetical protein n=1 Tax=Lichenihabitans psoromatis TaxID=2528642 RepID=UPI0010385DA2|nr:hypothetical protein [Lichenihabitans psoromatis]